MKKLLIASIVIVLFLVPAYSDSIVLFSTETNRCLKYIPSVDPSSYQSRIDALIFNDTSFQTEDELRVILSTTPIRYTKKNPVRNSIQFMTQAERNQLDSEITLRNLVNARAKAIEALNIISANPLLMRAVADIVKDEINILRKWDRDLKVAVAASSNLAQLKTNIAALPTLNDRTLAEFKNAIIVKINSGAAD